MSDRYDIAVLSSGLKVRAVGNNLLIRPDPPQEVSKGGIIFPGEAVEHVYNTGTVVAVGHGLAQAPYRTKIPGIEKGDRVYYIKYLEKQHSNLHMLDRLGENIVRIRPADVLLVFGDEDMRCVRPDLVAVR